MNNTNEFLSALRSATDTAHKALEELPLSQAIVSPHITEAIYGQYLTKMLRLHHTVEEIAFPVLGTLFPDLEKRRKTALLRKDLNELGLADEVEPADIVFQPTLPFALGLMYVTEGSTLGGRVILKNIEKVLGEGKAVSFFSGYRENTGPYWKEFLAVMDSWQQNASAREKEEMIAGAVRGFELAATIIGAGSPVTAH